jgi:hypothetical protein
MEYLGFIYPDYVFLRYCTAAKILKPGVRVRRLGFVGILRQYIFVFYFRNSSTLLARLHSFSQLRHELERKWDFLD